MINAHIMAVLNRLHDLQKDPSDEDIIANIL
jgi:uncharacterized protein YkuJ